MSQPNPDFQAEQQAVTTMYDRLDELRRVANNRLKSVRRAGPSGSPQNRSERDSFATLYEDRVALLDAVEDRLVFGRLDFDDTSTRYIGRIGLSDEEHNSLLTDWRADAAQPFYRATAARRDDVVRRRHLITKQREVTGVEDEILNLNLTTEEQEKLNLTGEGALLAAMATGRTGHMSDIVATIQSEQDEIIRGQLQGALVVQGGPGTGKTAVALHRAAYLLYAHRRLLERSGVLLIGPSQAFLRYIDQVLPALGETGVVSATIGSLLPGVSATALEAPEVAVIKGKPIFAKIIKRAIKARERVPAADIKIRVDGHDLVIRRRDIRDAMFKARRTNKPHNIARRIFVKEMLNRLGQQYVDDMAYAIDPADRGEIIEELRSTKEIRVALNIAWFPITPERLLEDLYIKPHRLAQAGPELSAAQRALLVRPAGSPWTEADIPLLDEAAELLGMEDTVAQAAAKIAEAEQQEALEYARQVLENSNNPLVNAQMLSSRFVSSGSRLTTAERAGKDRTWTYAHVIVDEAQELSAMAWRMLLRRCPTRSMTIVGDVAQTSSSAGARSWQQMLDPLLGDNWRRSDLTINYRTPAEIAQTAGEVATAANLPISELTSARSVPGSLTTHLVSPQELVGTVAKFAAQAADRLISDQIGRVAVITPQSRYDQVATAVEQAVGSMMDGNDPLVSVIISTESKGLEYDGVILVDPQEILAENGNASDLYVAMTRPTQELIVVHHQPLPAGL